MTSRRERYLLAVLAIITLSGMVTLGVHGYLKFTEIQPAHAGLINIALVGTPRFLNPVLTQINDVDSELSLVIFSGLFKYDVSGNLVPDLAEGFTVIDDGKTYEITLRKNLKWHDGQPLTVDDVIFTLQIIQNPDYKSPLRSLWQGINFEKIDGQKIAIKIGTVYAPFPGNLTFGILPKHLWEGVSATSFALSELNLKPIGSGPYQFVKYQKDASGTVKSFEVEAFEDYFLGKPFISDITFNFYSSEADAYSAYRKGETQAFSLVSSEDWKELDVTKNANLTIYPAKLPRYFAVFFNQEQNKFLADKTVRQALAYAANKPEIIKQVLGDYGTEINSPLIPGINNYTENMPVYNFSIDQAKSLLAANGWKDIDNDGILELEKDKAQPKLEFTLTTVGWPELTETANLLQNQWQQIGVKVNLQIVDALKVQNEIIKPRQYQALLFGEVIGIEPDLFHFWHSSQKKDTGLNLAAYEKIDVDRLLAGALEDMDNASRMQKYTQAAGLIAADLPAIFLFSPNYLFVADSAIKNVKLDVLNAPANRFSQINAWYVKTTRAWK